MHRQVIFFAFTGHMAPTFFKSPARLRAWLDRHHARARELLVGFYKKGAGKPSITYQEALDQALCYGWIDGVRRSIDQTSYSIRFTSRRPKSKWSAVNIKHFRRLEAAGLVKPPGRVAFERRDKKAAPYSFETRPAALEPAYERKLKANRRAWAFFQAQPPWYRRVTISFVMSAKQEKTRLRRLAELIERSAKGAWIGPLADRQPSKTLARARRGF